MEEDAEPFWHLMNQLDHETRYMLYEPGERTWDEKRILSIIHQSTKGNNLLLVATSGKELVGYLSADRGALNRIRHTAYIVTGIRSAYQGQGIGSRFFTLLDEWAMSHNITRLQLTVLCCNARAKHLYEKNGFLIEGIQKQSVLLDGVYEDEYYMAKLFAPQPE